MLIEDLTIEAEVTSLFGNNVFVKAIDISYGVNALSTATISIEIGEDAEILYHTFATYALSGIVGTDIKITWKGKELPIYEGKISGIQIEKSESNVGYSVNCSGGLLAFYNTELFIKGWYPQGAFSNTLPTIAFNKALFETEGIWNSPKTFMKALVAQLDTIFKTAKGTISKGTSDAASIAKQQLTDDLNLILEPALLQEIWGNVGTFFLFKLGVKQMLQNLVTQEGASFTYWALLLTLCEEIGLYVVPWINRTMILPHALFSNAPKANVIFPSLIRSIVVSTDPFNFPDQIIIPIDTEITTNVSQATSKLTESNSIAVPSELEERNSPYIGNRYKVVIAPKYARHILKTTSSSTVAKVIDLLKKDASQEDIKKLEGVAEESYSLYESYARNLGEFLYKRMRSERNTARVVCAFQPYMIPGHSCYTLDGNSGGMSFRGIIWGLNHSINETDAQTTVSLSHTIFPVTEEFKIKSPLWQKLLPNTANPKGTQIVTELMTPSDTNPGVPGFQLEAAEQISADETLFNDPAMDDAAKAAEFTGRA